MATQQQQRYRVIEKIAAGGMAEVYRAESAGLEGFKKTVAIKRVLPHLSQKKEFIGMFLDEARLSASLSHSNVVQVFDIGVGDDTYFIVMEYVEGANLKSIIEHRKAAGRPISIEAACLITLRICEGLSYAHEARDGLGQPLGIVHRDVSPPNVLLTPYGEVKVVDFGLAKANSQLEASEPGIIKGKFSYLSPEAALGEKVDHRTDVFAAGIILWEMITGQRLFLGDTDLATVRQVQSAKVPPLGQFNSDVPPALEHVMAQALARDPRQRYQTAREFGRDLNRMLFQLGRPVSSFDLGGLVDEVKADARRGRPSRPKQQTLIGTLIQDAMMSFTSLQNSDKSAPSPGSAPVDEESGVGAIPLSFGTFDGSDGSTPLIQSLEPSQVSLSPADAFEAGNLAALEDHAPNAPLNQGSMSSMLSGAAQPPQYDPNVLHPGQPSGQPPGAQLPRTSSVSPAPHTKEQGKAHWVVFAVVLMLIACAAAVYFAGVLD